MLLLTTKDVLSGTYSSALYIKTAPVRIKPYRTQADIDGEQESELSFSDVEESPHIITIGRCKCLGVEDEPWSCSLRSLLEDYVPVSEEEEEGYISAQDKLNGYGLYRRKKPQPIQCFFIPFPFVFDSPTKGPLNRPEPEGGIITWNGEVGPGLDMRVIKLSIFQKTYEPA